MKESKHIHFIGICGVAMSALAIAYHKKGYRVTGSDKGFYPPVSTYLTDAGISYYPGWHIEKMRRRPGGYAAQVEDRDPDLVIVGNVAGSNNPEWQYVQEKKLDYVSYPEAIARDFVRPHSIVCAGTYGKTTSSSILAWVLREAGFDPSYMFGGLSLNDMPAAYIGESEYSVLEGDEYKSARWDNGAKFFHYSPTHLLLTSVVWDHADVYPTEKSYVEAFEKLVKLIPAQGLLVVSEKVTFRHPEQSGVKSKDLATNRRSLDFARDDITIITYGKSPQNDYQYYDVQLSKHGVQFNIKYKSSVFSLQSSSLGSYMADNMTGCFAMAHQLGVEPQEIITHLASYKNIKRRLEKRFEGDITVFDDIAHSPTKAEAVLGSIRSLYDGKIFVVFEPNTGNRKSASLPGYDNAFASADEVIIPRLTTVKSDPSDPDTAIDGEALMHTIARTHTNVQYIEEDEELIEHLLSQTKKGDVIAFLGSHGFRGMIDQLVSKLSTKL